MDHEGTPPDNWLRESWLETTATLSEREHTAFGPWPTPFFQSFAFENSYLVMRMVTGAAVFFFPFQLQLKTPAPLRNTWERGRGIEAAERAMIENFGVTNKAGFNMLPVCSMPSIQVEVFGSEQHLV